MSLRSDARTEASTAERYRKFCDRYRRMIHCETHLCFTGDGLRPWHFYHFALRESRFGRSLVATRDITQGDKIACLPAVFVTAQVQSIGIEFDGVPQMLKLDEHLYRLIEGEQGLAQFSHVSTFLDHACWPHCNLMCDGHFWREGQLSYTLSALRDIRKGETVSIDYASIEYRAEAAACMQCGCGGANCRGDYRGFVGLSDELQREFIARSLIEAPVAVAIWQSLEPTAAAAFVRHYKAVRPLGDGELFDALRSLAIAGQG